MEWIFFPCLIFAVLVYVPITTLLVKQIDSQVLSKRSPIFVFISHIGNFLEVLTLLTADLVESSGTFLRFFQASFIVFHCLYFFPYLLRCYRLHFVFTLDLNWSANTDNFFRNRHRASQYWLAKVLAAFMLPVVIFAVLLISVKSISDIFPSSFNTESSDNLRNMKMFYIAACFIEELLFVIAVWACRNINDDFAMTTELTIVCALWFSNSFLVYWITRYRSWILTAAVRNFAIICVSSLWPLIRSFRRGDFGVPLTPEVLNSLELLLQNEGTLEAFYQFLRSGHVHKSVSTSDETMLTPAEREGYWLLDFWLRCEVYKHKPSHDKAVAIKEDFILPKLVPFQITNMFSAFEFSSDESRILQAQEYAFNVLENFYFPRFLKSYQYNLLLKEVNRQDIYLNRLTHTSFLQPAL